MLLNAEGSTDRESRIKVRFDLAGTAALITASTSAILFCPCDCIGQSPKAIILVSISIALGLAAAVLVFRRMHRDSGVTEFLKAVSALAIVGFGVYLEFIAASDIIKWLAARSL
jgi:hypothetical protein